MCEFQKRILICVADILFVAEYSPQHINQLPAMSLHSAENPTLRFFQRFWDWNIPQQLDTDSSASHNFSDY
jgi:hypothetical protein